MSDLPPAGASHAAEHDDAEHDARDPLDEFAALQRDWLAPTDDADHFDPAHGHREIEHPDLDRLRAFAMLLPEATEMRPFGLPAFRVAGRAFAMFEERDGRPTLCVKLTVEKQQELSGRTGIWPHPDTGHHGWTFLYLDVGIDWEDEVDVLVEHSYRLVAPAERVEQLEMLLAQAPDEEG